MDVSRITRGQLTLRRERVDLRTIIESAVETAQPQMVTAGVRLVLDLPQQPLTLDADATRISQVFLNLLTNAAKFTPSGGSVTVAAKTHPDRVSVIVRDTGIGIASEDQDRVFGMFACSSTVTCAAPTGLGIGLTLVKQMTELHAGSVAVWSEGLGKGTEFTINLPLAETIDTAGVPASTHPGALQKWSILVVDDSRDGADSLSFLLRAAGHDVHTAYDGRGALAWRGAFARRGPARHRHARDFRV